MDKNCYMEIEFDGIDEAQKEIFNQELKRWNISNEGNFYFSTLKQNANHPEPLFIFAVNLAQCFKDIFNKLKTFNINAFGQQENVLKEFKK